MVLIEKHELCFVEVTRFLEPIFFIDSLCRTCCCNLQQNWDNGETEKPRQYFMSIVTLSIFRNWLNIEWERIRTMFLVALSVKRWKWIWRSFIPANLAYKSVSNGRFTCRPCVLLVRISNPQFQWLESVLVAEFVVVVSVTIPTAIYLSPKTIFMFQMSHYQRRLMLILQSLVVVKISMYWVSQYFNHSITASLTGKEKKVLISQNLLKGGVKWAHYGFLIYLWRAVSSANDASRFFEDDIIAESAEGFFVTNASRIG